MINKAVIKGIGSYVPENIVKSEDIEKKFNLPAGEIFKMTGVRERRFANDDQSSSDLAIIAMNKALEDAKCDPKDVELIIFGSAIGDMAIPTTASRLQKMLGIRNCATLDINLTCLSFIAALDVARAYVLGGKYSNVLIAVSEITSKVIDWDEGEARFLLGDGAASVLVSKSDCDDSSEINAAYLNTDSKYNDLIHIQGFGNKNHPNSSRTTKKMNLFYMDGPAVLRPALRGIPDLVRGTMEYAKFNKNDIDFLITHQASIYGVTGAVKMFGIDKSKVLMCLGEHGNTASASIPITLDHYVKQKKVKKGDKLFLLGTAAGLCWGGITLSY